MWQFDVCDDRASQFRWRQLASNGRHVASSDESFASLSNADAAAAWFKANAKSAYDFAVYADHSGSCRRRATASNGQPVAVPGESFSSRNAAADAAANGKLNVGAAALTWRGDRFGS